MAKLIDLHVHSTFSDGTKTPSELVIYAKQKGLSAIALTDHDTIGGIEECMIKGQEEGIEVIPGVELTVNYDREIHMLGLNIDYKSKHLSDRLNKLNKVRDLRNHKIINKLNQLNIKINYQEVQKYAKEGFVGRPHIALAMVEKEYVKNSNEAFDKYLGEGKSAYFKIIDLNPEEAIDLIKLSGGFPILAHPGDIKLPPQELEELIMEFKNLGMMGIEVYHPDHNNEKTQFLLRLAKRLNLLISGGSDYHGDNKDIIDLGFGKGNLRLEYKILEDLKNHKLL